MKLYYELGGTDYFLWDKYFEASKNRNVMSWANLQDLQTLYFYPNKLMKIPATAKLYYKGTNNSDLRLLTNVRVALMVIEQIWGND